ncbi:MAG: PD-(D/E)XK nuclease domain-containing protein [Chromatiales bacterium]|nr:PD-(D/E)XK nuclease domain-containing protein [Chromatiales bacterium]
MASAPSPTACACSSCCQADDAIGLQRTVPGRSSPASRTTGIVNNPIARYEGYYASVFYSYFAALGLEIRLEDASRQGRLDMTLRFQRPRLAVRVQGGRTGRRKDGRCSRSRTRGYADKYRDRGRADPSDRGRVLARDAHRGRVRGRDVELSLLECSCGRCS